MKIVIATVQALFVKGGAELHAKGLEAALIRAGHEAELVTMPFMDNPLYRIESHIIAARLMEIEATWAGVSDLCIGLKFPAYCIPHSNKVIWALHQHRAAYDLFDTPYSNIKNDHDGRVIREIIENADNAYLREAKRVYANSGNVSARMRKYNGVVSTPLYHPCPDMDKFYAGEYGDYILMPSRINVTKRQFLAIEAMKHVKSGLKLYIMGRADNDIERERMLEYIRECGVEDRVRHIDFAPQEEKFKLYANARAVLFAPLDEDYGYITLEAMAASKAVITAADSGGPLEFVLDGITGLVRQPEPIALAEAIDAFASQAQAKEFGKAGKNRLAEMDITWEHVVRELTKP